MGSSIIYILLLIAIILTYYFVKRFRPQSGIFTYLITFAIVSPITLAGILLPITVFEYVKDLYQSEIYNAKIVDFTYETRERNDDDGNHYEITVKLPIVQLVTTQGDTITKEVVHYNSLYSYKGEAMYCKVNYNPSTGNVFIADKRGFYKMLSIMVFFALFFDFLLVGIVLYALGKNMTRYKQMLGIVLFRITIPMAILGFAAILLFAAYEESDMSLFAKIACIGFGVLLLLAFIGLIIILSNSKNKKRNRKRNNNNHQNNHRSHPSFLEFRK